MKNTPESAKAKPGEKEKTAQGLTKEQALDEALRESFPASDPVAVSVEKIPPA